MRILNEYYMYLLYIMYELSSDFFILFVQHQLVSFEYEMLSKSI